MHQLAARLRDYQVHPRQNEARTTRGYHRADFADPFRRYLPQPGTQPSQTVQLSAQAPDQPEPPDSSLIPDCPPTVQDDHADSRTVADTSAPGTLGDWPAGTIGAPAANGRLILCGACKHPHYAGGPCQ